MIPSDRLFQEYHGHLIHGEKYCGTTGQAHLLRIQVYLQMESGTHEHHSPKQNIRYLVQTFSVILQGAFILPVPLMWDKLLLLLFSLTKLVSLNFLSMNLLETIVYLQM